MTHKKPWDRIDFCLLIDIWFMRTFTILFNVLHSVSTAVEFTCLTYDKWARIQRSFFWSILTSHKNRILMSEKKSLRNFFGLMILFCQYAVLFHVHNLKEKNELVYLHCPAGMMRKMTQNGNEKRHKMRNNWMWCLWCGWYALLHIFTALHSLFIRFVLYEWMNASVCVSLRLSF